MDALRASYDLSSSDSEEPSTNSSCSRHVAGERPSGSLPPPPLALLDPHTTEPAMELVTRRSVGLKSASNASLFYCEQLRPHALLFILKLVMEEDFGAFHMLKETMHYMFLSQGPQIRHYIENSRGILVILLFLIPPATRKELIPVMRKVTSLVPGLHVVDVDVPLSDLCKDVERLQQVALGREFHISLGRTVPIRVHQIDSIVSMLRQKLQNKKRYWIDFSKWEVFVNDDQTRTFLSMEVIAGGLAEIRRQISIVDDIYRLHNLPDFYKNPRPHISLAWALGDLSLSLKQHIEELNRCCISRGLSKKSIFGCTFSGIQCKIGSKAYKIS